MSWKVKGCLDWANVDSERDRNANEKRRRRILETSYAVGTRAATAPPTAFGIVARETSHTTSLRQTDECNILFVKLVVRGNLLLIEASKKAAELQHPPSSLTERRGVGGKGRRGVCPFGQRIDFSLNLIRRDLLMAPDPAAIRYTRVMGILRLLSCLMLACGVTAPVFAQEGPLDTSSPKGISVEEIIKRFAAKETEFAKARDQYTYRQDVKVQTKDGETIDGEYHEVFDVIFDDKGKRIENVVFAPQSSLTKIYMDQGDFEDIRHKLPFVLTEQDLPLYNVIYVGQQQEDELHCFVFDVAPKKIEYANSIEKQKRYFQGRVWVDDHDYQIVKTYGKTVPDIRKKHGDEEYLYPKFTTWRQQIDGKYWFPVYTKADDELHFKMEDVHIIEIVKYEDYKRFGSKSTILYEGKEVEKAPEKKPGQTKPPEQNPPQK